MITNKNKMLQSSNILNILRCATSAYHVTRLRSTAAASNVEQDRSEISEQWDRARPFREMPTEGKLKLVRKFMPGGKYHNMGLMPLFTAIQQDYGDIFFWPAIFGKQSMVVTHNPEDIECVFRNEGTWPSRPGSEVMDYYRSKYRADFFGGVEGLITTSGKKWGEFRSAVNPILMQPRNIQLYLHKMAAVNAQFVEKIKQIRDPKTLEVPGNFEDVINRWTLESVSVVALDKQLGLLNDGTDDERVRKLFDSMSVFFHEVADLEFKPSLWKYVSTPTFNRIMKAFDNITNVTSSYINEAIARLEDEKARGFTTPEKDQGVVEKLLKVDKKIATVMAMDMLMGGVDTTTSTFVAALLCVAKNPEKQKRLRDEILNILPNKDSAFSDDALNKMPYMRACMKESMRIYPLVPLNGRVLQRDVVLSGYQVPRGTLVMMISATLLNNDKYYPHAGEFLPERWLRSADESALKASHPFVFLPFGFGPRSCIGKRIVEMELMLGIARLVRNFKIEFNHSTENAFRSYTINVPNIPLTFKFSDI